MTAACVYERNNGGATDVQTYVQTDVQTDMQTALENGRDRRVVSGFAPVASWGRQVLVERQAVNCY